MNNKQDKNIFIPVHAETAKVLEFLWAKHEYQDRDADKALGNFLKKTGFVDNYNPYADGDIQLIAENTSIQSGIKPLYGVPHVLHIDFDAIREKSPETLERLDAQEGGQYFKRVATATEYSSEFHSFLDEMKKSIPPKKNKGLEP